MKDNTGNINIPVKDVVDLAKEGIKSIKIAREQDWLEYEKSEKNRIKEFDESKPLLIKFLEMFSFIKPVTSSPCFNKESFNSSAFKNQEEFYESIITSFEYNPEMNIEMTILDYATLTNFKDDN